jgi:hypothetical protein
MSILYREFILNSPSVWAGIIQLVRDNAKALIENGTPLRVIVTTSERKRNSEQNKMMHAAIAEIADKAWWGGKQYPPEFWKEYFRRRYLLKDEYVTPNGEIVHTYWSTADKKFTVAMCSEFVTKIMAEAAIEWGVVFNA